MSISPEERNRFLQNPEIYVLRLGKNNAISVEKKGVWTWLKANIFCRSQYKLPAIIERLQASFLDPFLVKNLNSKVRHYNRAHPKNKIDLLSQKVLKQQEVYESPQQSQESSFIREAVLAHLTPYLEGKITAQTEDVNRPPLPPQILEKLQKEFPDKSFTLEEVKNETLQEYINIAAWKGAYATSEKIHYKRVFQRPDAIVAYILPALQHAVAIDFKGFAIPKDLKKLAQAAVKNYLAEYKNEQIGKT